MLLTNVGGYGNSSSVRIKRSSGKLTNIITILKNKRSVLT